MPRYTTMGRGDAKEPLQKFRLDPALIGEDVAERIAQMRKFFAQERDAMLNFQKECGKNRDVEGAKFFKVEAAHNMKLYRACCLLLPHVSNEWPGDCEYRDLYEVGEELFDAMEYIESTAIYGGWPV